MRKIVAMSANPDAGITTEQTSVAIMRTLTDRHPKIRYRVGADSKAAAIIGPLPYRVQDRILRIVFGI